MITPNKTFKGKFKAKFKGFTLIEVMLAMAVFALAGVALVGTAETTFRNMSNIETKVFAQWVANNQMVAASLDETWPPKDKQSGKVELGGREWHWRQNVIKTEDKEMRALEIEVRLNENDESSVASLLTYISSAK